MCYVLLRDITICWHESMVCTPCLFWIGCEHYHINTPFLIFKLVKHSPSWSPLIFGLSTTVCTLIMKELAWYYKSNETNVYACLLDASKAFDMIKFDKLFQILPERPFKFRLIILICSFSYRNQDIKVWWGGWVSSKFYDMNGTQ